MPKQYIILLQFESWVYSMYITFIYRAATIVATSEGIIWALVSCHLNIYKCYMYSKNEVTLHLYFIINIAYPGCFPQANISILIDWIGLNCIPAFIFWLKI